MFDSILVANRGEIALRVIKTAKKMGLRTVAVYSDADSEAPHVLAADTAVHIGPSQANLSYLNADAIIEAALQNGAKAIHPGYGFLSENADFARRVNEAGLIFVGPSPEVIELMGDKAAARELAASLGVNVASGSEGEISDPAEALRVAEEIGYPVMVKASAGGGGIGMLIAETAGQLETGFKAASDRAARVFNNAGLLIEKYINPARHIEIQVMGLSSGEVLILGERDCSVQRRFQKVVEESPAPGLKEDMKQELFKQAKMLSEKVGYVGAGTVEFLVNPLTGDFIFLEMNTRLQVEHPVTEMTTGTDLVAAQLLIAAGEDPKLNDIRQSGHAIEFRLYAENPKNFLPAPGDVDVWGTPDYEWLRIDSGVRAGSAVTPFYDPLIAKIIVFGKNRGEAIERAKKALSEIAVGPIVTNLETHKGILETETFVSGNYDTGLLAATQTARGR